MLGYSGSCVYSGQSFRRRYSFHYFYHKAQYGNMGRACVMHKVSHKSCSSYDYTYGIYAVTRFSPSELYPLTLSPAKSESSCKAMGNQLEYHAL
jgi:hypothetical protein